LILINCCIPNNNMHIKLYSQQIGIRCNPFPEWWISVHATDERKEAKRFETIEKGGALLTFVFSHFDSFTILQFHARERIENDCYCFSTLSLVVRLPATIFCQWPYYVIVVWYVAHSHWFTWLWLILYKTTILHLKYTNFPEAYSCFQSVS